MMKSIPSIIVCLLTFYIGLGQPSEFAKLDSFFTVLEEHDRFWGSVAVSRAGEIMYSKAIGYAEMDQQLPNTSETKFRIGSITKTFTATLTMKAVELGKIKLDDNIGAFFPQIQNADKITIRHLLNHRSGISTFTDRAYFDWHTQAISQADLLDKITDKGTDFEPDAQFSYSNSNYVLLTFILEDLFEKPYAQLLKEYITQPLNLTHTSYGDNINPTQQQARSYRMKTEWEQQAETHMSIPLGAGGIISTPSDLCLFAQGLFGGKILSSESLDQMYPPEGEPYGFAIESLSFNQMNGVGHKGDIDAFTSTLAYFEEEDLSFALTCNGANYGKHEIAIAVLSEVFGKSYQLPTFEFVELSSEELDQYVGTYESDQLPMDLMISKDGNELIAKGTGQAPFALSAEGNHQFSRLQIGLSMTFIPEKKKLTFEQGGMKFEMDLKQASESIELSSEELDQYIGTYQSEQLPMDITISKEQNTLIGQATGQSSFPLVAKGNHVFSNPEIGLSMTFTPDKKRMNLEQSGMKFEMTLVQ